MSIAPLSPSSTRTLLEQLQHRPRQQLGQNFLIDGNIVRKSLQLAEIKPGDTVIEVGPGLGTLTGALLEAETNIFAVELDPCLAAHLRREFAERIDLLEADAVSHPLGNWSAASQNELLPDIKIISNLPYAITSPWMEAVLRGPLPTRMVLMMQKEAVDRLCAEPGGKHMGAVSIFLRASYAIHARYAVARNCFYPVPGVDSMLLVLDRLPQPRFFSAPIRQAIRMIFTQRRKQLGALCRNNPILHDWFNECISLNLFSLQCRAEAVPLEAWFRLTHSLATRWAE